MNTGKETSVTPASSLPTQSMGSLNKDQRKAGDLLKVTHEDPKEASFSKVFEGARKSVGQREDSQTVTQESENPSPSDEHSTGTTSAKEKDRIDASDGSDKRGAHAASSGENADLSRIEANEVHDSETAPEPDIRFIEESAQAVPTADTRRHAELKPVNTEAIVSNVAEDDQPSRVDGSQTRTSNAEELKHSDIVDEALVKKLAPPSISEMAVAARQSLVNSSERNSDRTQVSSHSSLPLNAKTISQSIRSSETVADHGEQSEGLPFARPAESKHLVKGTGRNLDPIAVRTEFNGSPSAHLTTGVFHGADGLETGSGQATSAASNGTIAQLQGDTLNPGLPAAAPMITPPASRKTIENVEARNARGSGPPVQAIPSTAVQAAPPLKAIPASAVAMPISLNQPAGATEAAGATLLVANDSLQEMVWDQARTAALQGVPTGTPTRGEQSVMVMRQIAEAIPSATQRPVEIALSPEELGRVRISVISEDRSVTVQILAERPETLDLMRKHIDQLGNSFREMGYDSISFAFGQGSQSDDPPSDNGDRDTSLQADGAAEGEPSQAVLAVPLEAAATAGLDLRL